MSHLKDGRIRVVAYLVLFLMCMTERALSDEPDWFPLAKITQGVATDIVSTFTQRKRVASSLDYADHFIEALSDGKLAYPSYRSPIISLWTQPIRLLVLVDGTTNAIDQDIDDLRSLLAFIPDALPVPISISVQRAEGDINSQVSRANGRPNVIIFYSTRFGTRNPVSENPLQSLVDLHSADFPFVCDVVCHIALIEWPEDSLTTVIDSDIWYQYRVYRTQECCRFVSRNGDIDGGIYYNSFPLPFDVNNFAGRQSVVSQDISTAIRDAGLIRRVLASLTEALGARDPSQEIPGQYILPLSPLERSINDMLHRNLTMEQEFIGNNYSPKSAWQDTAAAMGICKLPDRFKQFEALSAIANLPLEIASSCLTLHRLVAAWRIVVAAGITPGMSPVEANRRIVAYVQKIK